MLTKAPLKAVLSALRGAKMKLAAWELAYGFFLSFWVENLQVQVE